MLKLILLPPLIVVASQHIRTPELTVDSEPTLISRSGAFSLIRVSLPALRSNTNPAYLRIV